MLLIFSYGSFAQKNLTIPAKKNNNKNYSYHKIETLNDQISNVDDLSGNNNILVRQDLSKSDEGEIKIIVSEQYENGFAFQIGSIVKLAPDNVEGDKVSFKIIGTDGNGNKIYPAIFSNQSDVEYQQGVVSMEKYTSYPINIIFKSQVKDVQITRVDENESDGILSFQIKEFTEIDGNRFSLISNKSETVNCEQEVVNFVIDVSSSADISEVATYKKWINTFIDNEVGRSASKIRFVAFDESISYQSDLIALYDNSKLTELINEAFLKIRQQTLSKEKGYLTNWGSALTNLNLGPNDYLLLFTDQIPNLNESSEKGNINALLQSFEFINQLNKDKLSTYIITKPYLIKQLKKIANIKVEDENEKIPLINIESNIELAIFPHCENQKNQNFVGNYKIEIYPNPAEDHFIVSTGDQFTPLKMLAIYNNQGKKIKTINFRESGQAVNVAEFNPGLYLIVGTSDNDEVVFSEKMTIHKSY